MPIDDFHSLQVFLDNFLARDFEILLGWVAASFTGAVDRVFLDQDANLLGQLRARRQFRHPLAGHPAFCQIALAGADQELLRIIACRARGVLCGVQIWGAAERLIQPFEGTVGVVANGRRLPCLIGRPYLEWGQSRAQQNQAQRRAPRLVAEGASALHTGTTSNHAFSDALRRLGRHCSRIDRLRCCWTERPTEERNGVWTGAF